ncbi:unnamed protein product, partial [marine sediment metagenome]
VDGGTEYLRRGGRSYIEQSVYGLASDRVKYLRWGTYGKNGDQPLQYKLLTECETDHLLAILENALPGPKYRMAIFSILKDQRELETDDIDRLGKAEIKWDSKDSKDHMPNDNKYIKRGLLDALKMQHVVKAPDTDEEGKIKKFKTDED